MFFKRVLLIKLFISWNKYILPIVCVAFELLCVCKCLFYIIILMNAASTLVKLLC